MPITAGWQKWQPGPWEGCPGSGGHTWPSSTLSQREARGPTSEGFCPHAGSLAGHPGAPRLPATQPAGKAKANQAAEG